MSKKSIERLTEKEKKVLEDLLKKAESGLSEKLLEGISAVLCAAFIESLSKKLLEDPNLLPFLKSIKERFPEDKNIKKALKRISYKLRLKGIDTSQIEEKEEGFVFKLPERGKNRVYIGPIVGPSWRRQILFELYTGSIGVDMGVGIISDIEGVSDFAYTRLGKKRFKALKEEIVKIAEQSGEKFVETTLPHGRKLFEEACSISVSDDAKGVEELKDWLLNNVPPLERHPLEELISKKGLSVKNISKQEIDELFSNEIIRTWKIENSEMKMYSEELKKIEESPIIVSDYTKKERIKELRDKYRKKLFPEDLFIKRFNEMAYYFLLAEEEKTGILCLKAANSLKDPDLYVMITDKLFEISEERRG